jgi:CRP/FNR family transcriptional regulator, cyclic AMP receptor protein
MDTSNFFQYPTEATEPRTAPPAFLGEAGEREWDALLSYMQTRQLRAGEIAFREGDPDRALYLLTAGRIELRASAGPTVAVDAPAPLNEIAFLDGGRSAASARALGDGELLRLSFDAFESLAAREPTLARRILLDLGRIVATRLRQVGR